MGIHEVMGGKQPTEAELKAERKKDKKAREEFRRKHPTLTTTLSLGSNGWVDITHTLPKKYWGS